MGGKLMPLGFIEVGHEAIIKKIMGGSGMHTKLGEMGFAQGTKIHIIRNDGSGPMVVSVMDSRMAIGRGMAQKIMVEEIAS